MMFRVLLAVLLLSLSAAAADSVGLITSVTGNVQVVRAGQQAPSTARTAELIGAGDKIVVGPDSHADFLFCPQSKAARIPAGAEIIFDALALVARKGKLLNERAVPSCRLPGSLMLGAASQQRAGVMRLRGANLLLRTPSRTNLATPRPLFRWGPVDNAKQYELEVLDREEKVLWKVTLSGTETQYPADAQQLAWGQKYRWRVTARDAEDAIAEAGTYFQMLDEKQAQEVTAQAGQLEKLMKENPSDPSPRYLLAFLYDANGMLDEAVRTYAQLGDADWVKARVTQLMNKLGWDKLEP